MKFLHGIAALSPLVSFSIAQEVPNAAVLQNTIETTAYSCTSCRTLLGTLKAFSRFGDDAVVNSLTAICIQAGFEDDDVCRGIIAAEGPILAHTLRGMSIPSHSSDVLCTSLLGTCDLPEVRSYQIKFPKPKPNATRPAPSGEEPLQFVHFSDIHIDHEYQVGSNYNCSKPLCCRPYTPEDAAGNATYKAGPFGEHSCDSPKVLELAMYEAIQKAASNASFALFTGDIPDHAVWLINQTAVTYNIEDAYNEMASILSMPVYGTLGNHESSPVNSFPFKGVQDPISNQWIYDIASAAWKRWIGKKAADPDHYGAYSYKANKHLRVISINTNLFYKFNFWMYQAEMPYDADGQFAWLVNELQSAEDAGERVYIMGHMPPGVSDALHDGSNYFNQIVNRYEATIAAMFWGHTHKDHFELSYSDRSDLSHLTATMVSYISPSLTPTSGAPAFRVFTVDPVTFGVLGFKTYAAPLEEPDYQHSGPDWKAYYSAKEAYGPLVKNITNSSELTPAFWHNVTVAFEKNDDAFQAFIARKTRGWDVSPCIDDCKKSEICQLRAAEAQYNCLKPVPRDRVLKEDRHTSKSGGRHDDDCGGSGIAAMLQYFAGKQTEQVYKQDL